MSQDASLLELSGAIYDTAQSPERWPEVLRTLANLFGASECLVAGIDKGGPHIVFAAAANRGIVSSMTPGEEGEFRLDQRLLGGLERASGEVYTAEGRAGGDAHSLAAFLDDGAGGPFLGLVLANDGGHFAVAYATRPKRSAAFSEVEVGLMARLRPHLCGGYMLGRQLKSSERERRAALTALDRLAVGVIVVDGAGQVRFCNGRAEAIFGQRDGLVLGPEGLKAESAAETAALHEAIDNAGGASDGASATVLSVHRSSMSRPLELLVAPLTHGHDDNELSGALIFVGDPEQRPEMVSDALVHLYGLSRSEAELAAELASGKTLAQFADERARNIETARKTLKRVFAKTDTGRQAELVGRLLTGPLTFVNGGIVGG